MSLKVLVACEFCGSVNTAFQPTKCVSQRRYRSYEH